MTGFSEVYCSGLTLASASAVTSLRVQVSQIPGELQ